MLEISLFILVSLIFLWFINRYIFSWLGLILNLIGLIHYKTVDNIEESVRGKRLSFRVELANMAAVISKNPDYQVLNHGHSLYITRKWGKVQYGLFFTNNVDLQISRKSKGYFSVSNQRENSIDHGEKPCIPSHILKRRTFRMINDLPLSRLQKQEIKKSIRIRWGSRISLGWI